MLEFEDEIDPAIVEAAVKAHPQRPKIMPPNVEDLKLMDATGGGMCYGQLERLRAPHNLAFLRFSCAAAAG